MKRLVVLLSVTLLGLFAMTASAQEEPTTAPAAEPTAMPTTPPGSAALDAWVGTWNATGTWMGAEATQTVMWEWVVDGWHIEGHVSTVVTTPEGPQTTNSILYLTPAGDGTLVGHWIYPMGLHFAVTGAVEGNVVTFGWTAPDGVHQYVVTSPEEGHSGLHRMQAEDGTWHDADIMTYTAAAE